MCEDPSTFCAARFGSTLGSKGKLCDASCNSFGRCQKTTATASTPFFKVKALKKQKLAKEPCTNKPKDGDDSGDGDDSDGDDSESGSEPEVGTVLPSVRESWIER